MTPLERIGLALLHRFDPERAHDMAHLALRAGFGPSGGPYTSSRLRTGIASLTLPNPVGLAAGFDKNATLIEPLAQSGFGFLEVGAATPRAQPGNPKPRLFRLGADRAAINRFGFNNEGMETIATRLAHHKGNLIVGLNLGANKDSADKAGDFSQVLSTCRPFIDFATVNVSSPNTEKLRDLQGAAALRSLLSDVIATRAQLDRPIPIFLKIAPDLADREIGDVAEVAQSTGVDAIIATNTTLSRDGLQSPASHEAGGLSGAPLFEKSTRVLARLSDITNGALPLVGVGGISTAEHAYAKICAGASVVQLYTALIYGGMSLVGDITRGLDALLERDGFSNVADAVGSKRKDWL